MRQTFLEKLLTYYHISLKEYHHLIRPVTLDDIPSADNFKDIDKAASLVKEHMNKNHKIVIYGDYDADGITACSILVKMFKYLHYEANYYIPSRYIDGYGINETRTKEIIDKGYRLVITVDNGVSAVEPIKLLREANIDVLVIDHHEAQQILPDANYIIHPILSNYSTINSSAAFTSFMFSSKMLNRYDKYLSTLAAISIISDMMPLKDYNRDFLRSVISTYKIGEFPQIDYLLENGSFDDTGIGMSISPKINAVGRMDKSTNINRLVKYFTSDNEDEILSYKKWILSYNELRKVKSKEAKEEIILNLKDYEEKALVIKTDIEEGLLGLVANSLMNQLGIPVIVLTTDTKDDSCLKGSARGVEGLNLSDSFQKLSHLLLNYGGHALAAGLSIKKDNYEEFKEAFIKLITDLDLTKKDKLTVDLSINEICEESYNLIKSFAPFGEGWKAPLFKLRHVKASELMYSKNLLNIVTSISFKSRIVGFNFSKEMMKKYNYVDLIGTIKLNVYNRNSFYEFHISEISESK